MTAQLNEFTQLDMKGQASWLEPLHDLNLTLKIEDLDLTPFSPLIEPVLEEQINQGNLTSTSQITIQQAQLNAKNKVLLSQFALKPTQTTEVADVHDLTANTPADESLLNYSLDVLRDKNNQIKLNVPIKGDINSPNFDLTDIFQVALYKGLTAGSKHLIMTALQPYDTIYTVGELAYDLISEIRVC